jgi:hypothetical protein
MKSSRNICSLLDAYKGLGRPQFLSLYHSMRVAAGGELPSSEWAASQIFPSFSSDRVRWKAANFSELSDIVGILVSAIKNRAISVYKKENECSPYVEINTKVFLNETIEIMSCLDGIKSGDITYSNIYFKTDEFLGIFFKKKSSFYTSQEGLSAVDKQSSHRKRSGKAPEKTEKAKLGMLQALEAGQSVESLRDQTEQNLANQYGCGRETVRRAREAVIKEYRQK